MLRSQLIVISWAVVVVVRMLALYSDDTSSKTCVYNFFVKFFLKRPKINITRLGLAHLKLLVIKQLFAFSYLSLLIFCRFLFRYHNKLL